MPFELARSIGGDNITVTILRYIALSSHEGGSQAEGYDIGALGFTPEELTSFMVDFNTAGGINKAEAVFS